MKVKKFQPFLFERKEKHEAWLADMARQGWRYQGGNILGFQYFEQSAPAEVVFCWDQSPRAKDNVLTYRQQCCEAGWDWVGAQGRWNCWRKAVVPGEPVQPLRDRASAIAMYFDIQRQLSAQQMMLAVVFFLQLPNLTGVGRPRWLSILMLLSLAVGTVVHLRGALYAKARKRELEAGS